MTTKHKYYKQFFLILASLSRVSKLMVHISYTTLCTLPTTLPRCAPRENIGRGPEQLGTDTASQQIVPLCVTAGQRHNTTLPHLERAFTSLGKTAEHKAVSQEKCQGQHLILKIIAHTCGLINTLYLECACWQQTSSSHHLLSLDTLPHWQRA